MPGRAGVHVVLYSQTLIPSRMSHMQVWICLYTAGMCTWCVGGDKLRGEPHKKRMRIN